MKLSVGKLLFFVKKKSNDIIPVLIVEEHMKRTLHGNSVDYIVQVGDDKANTIALSDLDGELYESASAAKGKLIQRVSSAISSKVDQAVKLANVWYKDSIVTHDDDSTISVNDMTIKITDNVSVQPDVTVAERDVSEEPEPAQVDSCGAGTYKMPDGTQVKVVIK